VQLEWVSLSASVVADPIDCAIEVAGTWTNVLITSGRRRARLVAAFQNAAHPRGGKVTAFDLDYPASETIDSPAISPI